MSTYQVGIKGNIVMSIWKTTHLDWGANKTTGVLLDQVSRLFNRIFMPHDDRAIIPGKCWLIQNISLTWNGKVIRYQSLGKTTIRLSNVGARDNQGWIVGLDDLFAIQMRQAQQEGRPTT